MQKIEGFLAFLNVTGGNFSPQSQKIPFAVTSVDGDKYLLYYSSINLSGKLLSGKSRVAKFQRTLSMDESRSEKPHIRVPMKGRIQLVIHYKTSKVVKLRSENIISPLLSINAFTCMLRENGYAKC